jgi:hypothetical protein
MGVSWRTVGGLRRLEGYDALVDTPGSDRIHFTVIRRRGERGRSGLVWGLRIWSASPKPKGKLRRAYALMSARAGSEMLRRFGMSAAPAEQNPKPNVRLDHSYRPRQPFRFRPGSVIDRGVNR